MNVGMIALGLLGFVGAAVFGRIFIRPPPAPKPLKGEAEMKRLLASAPIDPLFRVFLLAKARRESRFSSTAHNASAREVSASRRLTNDAIGRGFFRGNPFIDQIRRFGSGGPWGLLSASGLAAGGRNGPFRRASPQILFNPRKSLAAAADYGYRLTRWRTFRENPTWEVLALGWASGSLMDDDDNPDPRIFDPNTETAKAVLRRFRDDLDKIGAPGGFARQRVRLGYGGDVRGLLAALEGVA